MEKFSNKLSKVALYITLGFIFFIFLLPICPIPLQNDTFYDIVLGGRYLHQGMFHIDDYSIHSGLIYQTHHYFVCILNYLVYTWNPARGLYLLEIALTAIIGLLFYLNNREYLKSKAMSYIIMYIQIVLMIPFISVRAQMFSYIIFLIELLVLQRYIKSRKKLYLFILGILPLILINVHSGTIYFYFIIMGTYMVEYLLKIKFNFNIEPLKKIFNNLKKKTKVVESQEKGSNLIEENQPQAVENVEKIEQISEITVQEVKAVKDLAVVDKSNDAKKVFFSLMIVVLIGSLLTLINPYGLQGILYGLKTINNEWINKFIAEFQPFSIKGTDGYSGALYALILISSLMFSKKKVQVHEYLLTFGTIFMALLSIRHISLYIISTVVVLANTQSIIDYVKEKLKMSVKLDKFVKIIIYSIFIVLAIQFHVEKVNDPAKINSTIPENYYPVKAVEYLKQNLKDGDYVLNEYAWGSYLMFNNIKVFIDSRCDLYTEQYNPGVKVAEDYMKAVNLENDVNSLMDKYKLKYVLIFKDSKLSKLLAEKEEYTNVYQDAVTVIYKYEKAGSENTTVNNSNLETQNTVEENLYNIL